MIGIVDAGNTQIKAAIFDANQLVKHAVYKGFENDLTDFFIKNNVKKVFISSVIEIPQAFLHNNNFSIQIFNASHNLPIKNKYNSIHTLGNDRLANAVAAFMKNNQNGPVLAIDFGTCIKFDFVDQNANYLGGSISPGFQMRLKALNTFTQKLPKIEVNEIPNLIGTSSNESIASGVVNGIIAEVDGLISQYVVKYPSVKVFLTGGDAPFFSNSLKNNIFAIPFLTCYGLNAIANLNGID